VTVFNVPLASLRQRRSLKWRRYPPEVLPLWLAELDAYLPPAARAAIERATALGDFGYPGGHILQPAWIRYAHDTWDLDLAEGQVSLALDVVGAMTAAVECLTASDATIALTQPVYPPFREVATAGGRRARPIDQTPDGRLDLAAIERTFAVARPAMFLVCNPDNPQGTIASPDELAAVAELARRYDVLVLVDEIHSLIHDPGAVFTPYLTVPGADRGLVATSASKGFGLAGLKAGLLLAGPQAQPLLGRIPARLRQTDHLALLAQAAALDGDRDWLAQLNREVTAHKAWLAGRLAGLGLTYQPSPATYLAWVDCSVLGLADPTAHFLDHGHVAFNSGVDYDPGRRQWLRINLATSPDILDEAIRRLAASL
jgi:cystathionine beta-lyase